MHCGIGHIVHPQADLPQADTNLPPPPHSTMGYGQQASGAQPTGMHFCDTSVVDADDEAWCEWCN